MCRRIFKYQTTESGDIPFFKIGSFGGTPDAFISKDLFESFKVKYPYPEKGDVLISASGSIGRTVVFTGKDEYFQDSNIVWLKHNNSIINSFLNYLYSTVKWAGIEGTTIKRLYNDNILKTEAIIPTLLEQQKISDYLDGINHLITLHQSKSFGYIFKAIVSFTLYWEQRKLVNLCEKFTDGDWIEAKDQSHSGVRLIQTGNVGLGEYIDKPDNKKWISEETFVLLNCEEVLAGDILISRLPEPAGRACIVPSLGTKIIAAVDCTIVRVATKINPKYLLQYLSSQSYFDEVNTCLAGGTRQRISRSNLADFDIPIPAKYEEQKAIGEFLFCIDHLITLHQLEPFQLIFKAIAYRIIDYAKSKPPRHRK